MIAEPRFWRDASATSRLAAAALSPLAALYDGAQRLRAAATFEAEAPLPVFCVGAATLGGVGKTPFALLLARRLAALGQRAAFLTRGYGGRLAGPILVDPSVHGAAEVGDEALLLAAAAPTFVSRNRPRGAALVGASDAQALVMDDGYQNPTLRKNCAFLLIDTRDPCGNGRVFPSGPLREPIRRALSRADAVVLIGDGPLADGPLTDGPLADGPVADLVAGFSSLVLRAAVAPRDAPPPQRVLAFCGIGAPHRFFDLLRGSDFEVAESRAFPDHHPYTTETLATLRADAARARAALITTTKDFARIAPDARRDIFAFPIELRVDDGVGLDALLAQTVDGFNAGHVERARA